MTGKATLTTTRSGRPRENVSPQALAAEVEQLKSEVGGLRKVLAPAFTAPPDWQRRRSFTPGHFVTTCRRAATDGAYGLTCRTRAYATRA